MLGLSRRGGVLIGVRHLGASPMLAGVSLVVGERTELLTGEQFHQR
ncbi:MAG: hypothetical protein ACK5YZ_01015 [bacterium]